jgi:GDP-4-dehydro-6-deoxy-D-mannose reductase
MTQGATLVTGAAGFAGGHLLDQLCGCDAGPVDAWSRPGGTPVRVSPHTRWRPVDLLSVGDVVDAIKATRPRRIYHLAGAPHVGASWHTATSPLEIHVRGTHHLLEAVRAHAPDCRVLVVTSGTIYRPQDHGVDEDAPCGPASPYGLSKLAEDLLSQHAARHDGLDVVIARPFNHIGPRQSPEFAASSFARQIAAIEAGAAPAQLSVGNLDTERDLTDVRDVTAAYVALMRSGRPGVAYNVCRGETVSMRLLVERLIALSTAHVTVVQDPTRLRPNDSPFLGGDASRLRRETGWTPRIPLEQTLLDLLNLWRQSFAAGR